MKKATKKTAKLAAESAKSAKSARSEIRTGEAKPGVKKPEETDPILAERVREDRAFEQRLAERNDEMKWLYMELYDDQHAYDYFVEMLRRTYEKRSRTLREWDDWRATWNISGSWG
ncbi:hypothetical protein [Eubacterium pyruvativorans]|uniref:hypothetical protein n=1 Tax=Eubacterium pyruvativorans TaxID=155865 RepID=UPI0030B8FF1C